MAIVAESRISATDIPADLFKFRHVLVTIRKQDIRKGYPYISSSNSGMFWLQLESHRLPFSRDE